MQTGTDVTTLNTLKGIQIAAWTWYVGPCFYWLSPSACGQTSRHKPAHCIKNIAVACCSHCSEMTFSFLLKCRHPTIQQWRTIAQCWYTTDIYSLALLCMPAAYISGVLDTKLLLIIDIGNRSSDFLLPAVTCFSSIKGGKNIFIWCTNNPLVINGCLGGNLKSATTASIRNFTGKDKGKVVSVLIWASGHYNVRESGDIPPCILIFGIAWRSRIWK